MAAYRRKWEDDDLSEGEIELDDEDEDEGTVRVTEVAKRYKYCHYCLCFLSCGMITSTAVDNTVFNTFTHGIIICICYIFGMHFNLIGTKNLV